MGTSGKVTKLFLSRLSLSQPFPICLVAVSVAILSYLSHSCLCRNFFLFVSQLYLSQPFAFCPLAVSVIAISHLSLSCLSQPCPIYLKCSCTTCHYRYLFLSAFCSPHVFVSVSVLSLCFPCITDPNFSLCPLGSCLTRRLSWSRAWSGTPRWPSG